MGDLNIKDPTTTPSISYMASRNATTYLINSLKADSEFESEAHNNCVYTSKLAYFDESQIRAQQVNDRIISEINDFHKRTVMTSCMHT